MATSTGQGTARRDRVASFAHRLREAHGCAELGLVTCAAAREQELDCHVALLAASGRPLITVEHVAAVEKLFTHTVPIHGLTEHLGLIRWSGERPFDDDRAAELGRVGIQVALRLAELGYTSCRDDLDGLTARQLETAGLAARGHSNTEIAALLGVSENTVKKHLRDVFERLQLGSRTELARRFGRLATIELAPAGTRQVGDCRVTRLVANLPR